MAVSYQTALATTRMQAVLAAINSQTVAAPSGTASAGSLVIGTSSFTNTQGTASVTSSTTGVLVVIPLPTGGLSVSGRVLTLISGTDTAVATASGTAANAAVINNAGTIVAGGLTVGTTTGSFDVVVATTAISANQNVNLNSATLAHSS